MRPNEEQLRAIQAPLDKPVRVLAGPGSGKTQVLALRYAYLVENGVKPEGILAVTFSKSMASELLSRIVRHCPAIQGTEAEEQICTIHACCYRILRAEGDQRRVAKEWQIKNSLQSIASELWKHDPPGYKEILYWIDRAKAEGPDCSPDLFTRHLGEKDGSRLFLARARFDKDMARRQLITFPDMLLEVETRLMQDTAFRERWQNRFQYVILDEAQDTTAQAMRILTTLAQPENRIFMVGDTDQLLYRFTGATPEANLLDGFESRYPDGITIKLTRNYRSTKTIVNAQLNLISHNYSGKKGPYDEKYLKELRARDDAPKGEPLLYTEHDSPEEESLFIATELQTALSNGRKPGDFFVAARTRAQLGYLEGPLLRAKIPFANLTSGSFWSSKHVSDVVAYLRLAADTTDSNAFKRVYNIASVRMRYPWGERKGQYCHHRFLGDAFLQACQEQFKNAQEAALTKSSFQPGVKDLTEFVSDLQSLLKAGPAEAIQFIISNCYEKYLKAEEGLVETDQAEDGKLEDLETVIAVARQFQDVGAFLDYVKEAEKAAEAAQSKSWNDYVVLSTVHRLKGLERPVVYGIGLSEGLLPHASALGLTMKNGRLPQQSESRLEDELCICFVLISRAKEEVHLSHIRTYREKRLEPSRFLKMMKGDEK